jgi:hypothetical protein
MNWKIEQQSSLASGGVRVVHMAVDCSGGEIAVRDLPTAANSFESIEKTAKSTFGDGTDAEAVKYLAFEHEDHGELYGQGGPVFTDAQKSRQNENARRTATAVIWGGPNDSWHKHIAIHELMHALGASQGLASPAAPYSTPDNVLRNVWR